MCRASEHAAFLADKHSARCRLSVADFAAMRCSIGAVAELHLVLRRDDGRGDGAAAELVEAAVLCVLWPDHKRVLSEGCVVVDPSCVKSTRNSSNHNELLYAVQHAQIVSAKVVHMFPQRNASVARVWPTAGSSGVATAAGAASGVEEDGARGTLGACVRAMPLAAGVTLLTAQGQIEVHQTIPPTNQAVPALMCGKQTSVLPLAAAPSLVNKSRHVDLTSQTLPDHVVQIIQRGVLPQLAGFQGPWSFLLYGPAGTGKTYTVRLLQQFMAKGGYNARIFELRPHRGASSESIGDSSRAVSNMDRVFARALKHGAKDSNSLAVIFIDELEGFSLQPQEALQDPIHNLLNHRLVHWLDRLSEQTNVRKVLIGATNRPQDVDKALRRGGRFEVEIRVSKAAPAQRYQILQESVRLSPPLLDWLCDRTAGYTPADLLALAKDIMATLSTADMAPTSDEGAEDLKPLLEQSLRRVRPAALRSLEARLPSSIRMDDIIGQHEAKQRLQRLLVWPLLMKEQCQRFGLSDRGGLLLHGPPGCSKTSLVRAAAAEANIPLVAVSGADVYSPYVGEAEATLRELFSTARQATPCIIFVDELDALVSNRASEGGDAGAHSPESRVLATFLTELDGIQGGTQGMVFIGATNRPWAIDVALLRQGRLEHMVYVAPPSAEERAALFERLLAATPMMVADASSLDLEALSAMTEGFTGADIENVVREACMACIRQVMATGEMAGVIQEELQRVVEKTTPSVTTELVAVYEAFNSQTRDR